LKFIIVQADNILYRCWTYQVQWNLLTKYNLMLNGWLYWKIQIICLTSMILSDACHVLEAKKGTEKNFLFMIGNQCSFCIDLKPNIFSAFLKNIFHAAT